MFDAERLRPLPPVVFPVVVTEQRTATRQALIDWRGNRYSVPPELAAAKVTVQQRLGTTTIDIATGTVVARHTLAQPGLGVTVRDSGHVTHWKRSHWRLHLPAARTGARNASHPGQPPSAPLRR
jgi:hypothetical protein